MSEPAADPSRRTAVGFVIAWTLFWLLLATIAVQDHRRRGGLEWWPPLLWEATSFVVATVIVALHWPRLARSDGLLGRPVAWFARQLMWLPLAAPAFVAVVFALRHGAYGLIGAPYRHEPWSAVLPYESLKFALFYLLFVAIVFGLRSHAALGVARLRAEQERALSREAQLRQLTQQLEPHFLFNALNTIAASVHDDPDLADTLLLRLAALLRAASDLARQPEIPLAEELRLLDAYVAIMRARHGERVRYEAQVDDAARHCRVPTLLLQPLVENVFRHVVERQAGPIRIVVSARLDRAGARLVLEVENDAGRPGGAEAATTRAAAIAATGTHTGAEFDVGPTHGTRGQPAPGPNAEAGRGEGRPDIPRGTGLTNLSQRLALRHGKRASFHFAMRPAGGALARIELPCDC